MLFRQFFDQKLAQYAYLVGCQKTGEALIIDPERDIDRYVEAAEAEGLRITAVAETHIHADFLSGAREFAAQFGTRVYLSEEGGEEWASDWARGGDYDVRFLKDGDSFKVGGIEVTAAHTPGHTPEHISFVIVDRGGGASTPIGVATGDFVFVGDLGRPDLLEQAAGMHGVQEPSARQLYASLPRFTELADYVQVWPAHGAGSTCGKNLGAVPQTTVGYEKLYNPSLNAADDGEDAFVDAILAGQPEPQTYFARMKRDNNKGVPLLGGQLPSPRRLTVEELKEKVAGEETLVLDTRLDRSAFMARHIPGSLHAPMNRSFNTAVGSLVEDETVPIVLVLEEGAVEEAVRDLVRIGYDNLVGFATPETLTRYFDREGPVASIPEVDFDALAEGREAGKVVVDARFAAEYADAHVPGAISASYTRLPSLAPERLPKDRTLMVHCGSGARAAAAAAFLAREGYTVEYVNGSFEKYSEEGPTASGPFQPEAREPAVAG